MSQKQWKRSVFSQISSSQTISENSAPTENTNSKRVKRSASFSTTASTSNAAGVANKKPVKSKQLKSAEFQDSNALLDSFAPKDADDLALHAKKMTELRNWFLHCDALHKKNPAQLCLLTGPAGAGKTASVRVLAAAYGYDLQEWVNPVDRELVTTLGDQTRSGANYFVSQIDAFKSFLLRASRYKSLLNTNEKRLLLVEDFPNALLSDAAAFESILTDYMNYGKSPLIFIVADSKSRTLNIAFNLFSEPTKCKFRINHIALNPIATTLMQKAMKRFCAIMRESEYEHLYVVPKQIIIDSIVVAAQGDIRNALLNLNFSSLKGAPVMLTQAIEMEKAKAQTSKKTKKQAQQTTLKSVGRDESITILHALGRVFNPKFTDEQKFLHTPEEIAEAFSTEPKNFIDFTFANYLPHFGDIESVKKASNDISQADLLLREYREDALSLTALNIALRGVMVANKAPISGWMPIRSKQRWQLKGEARQKAINEFGLNETISIGLFATEFAAFVKCIQDNKKSQK